MNNFRILLQYNCWAQSEANGNVLCQLSPQLERSSCGTHPLYRMASSSVEYGWMEIISSGMSISSCLMRHTTSLADFSIFPIYHGGHIYLGAKNHCGYVYFSQWKVQFPSDQHRRQQIFKYPCGLLWKNTVITYSGGQHIIVANIYLGGVKRVFYYSTRQTEPQHSRVALKQNLQQKKDLAKKYLGLYPNSQHQPSPSKVLC